MTTLFEAGAGLTLTFRITDDRTGETISTLVWDAHNAPFAEVQSMRDILIEYCYARGKRKRADLDHTDASDDGKD